MPHMSMSPSPEQRLPAKHRSLHVHKTTEYSKPYYNQGVSRYPQIACAIHLVNMSHHTTDTEEHRAVYVYTYMLTHSKRLAEKASGLGPHAFERIVEKLKTTFTLSDAPRPGRPTKFTPEVLGHAVLLLTENSELLLTTKDLLDCLIFHEVLPENTDEDNFRHHLREYISHLGFKLIVNKVGTTFYLHTCDEPKRVEASVQFQELLLRAPLPDWIATDETEIDLGGHPKGEHGGSTVHATVRSEQQPQLAHTVGWWHCLIARCGYKLHPT
jgi:hypothetical protein